MLVPNATPFDQLNNMYKATASIQSFVKYDLHKAKAYDLSKTYTSITLDLYSDIRTLTGEPIVVKKGFNPDANKGRIIALAPPTISSFSTNTLTSGTSTELTINGSNFGIARGTGKVGFKDANFGDGRYYYSPTSWSYVSWNNTQIKVIVPTRAGTGTVQVINNGGESGESTTNLTVNWAHLNVKYPLSSTDTPFFELQHINDDNAGGYTWNMTTSFANSTDAVNAFDRSMNEWKCETEMNWTIGSNTSNHDLASDGTNTVRWTSYTDSRLGVCYSRYGGCFTSGGADMSWYVTETDIEFDSTRNWYFGTGSPANNEYDFESVATHELGHGHQLGHVRASEKVMHYSISNGQRKPDLVTTDIAAGNYIKNKSVTNTVCNKSKMTLGICPSTPPTASFTTSDNSVCPNTNITFTSTSSDNTDTWIWDFGSGATLTSATTEGPHIVGYTTSGTKTIRLIAVNTNGTDTVTQTVTIKPGQLDEPSSFVTEDTACKERVVYTLAAIPNAQNYTWTVASGGSIVSNAINKITVEWQDTGVHTIDVKALGECGDSPLKEETVFVMGNPIADFSFDNQSISVDFSSTLAYTESVAWDFGDEGSSTETNPTHRFVDKGDYTVTLTATNRCGEVQVQKEIAANYGVGINQLSNNTSVYPNPIRIGESLTIKGTQYDNYELYSPSGQLVEQGNILSGQIPLNVSSKGLFMLVLKTENHTVNYKITVIE